MIRFLGFLLLLPPLGWGAPIVLADQNSIPVPLEMFEDRSAQLEFEDVSKPEFESQFKIRTQSTFDAGNSKSVFWLRFRVVNPSLYPQHWVAEIASTTDLATLFERKGDALSVRHTGQGIAFADREIQASVLAFRLDFEPHEERTLYVRMSGDDSLSIGATLHSTDNFWKTLSDHRLFLGLYFGVILAMVVCNIVVFAVTRDRASIWYSVFEISIAFLIATHVQLSARYLWPHATEWAAHSKLFISGIIFLAATQFTSAFLQFEEPWARPLKYSFTAVALYLSLASIFFYRAWLWVALGILILIMCTTALGLGLYALIKKRENALLFVIAWSAILVSGIISGLSSLGYLLSISPGYGVLEVGSLIEALLLALAIALRLRRITQEKELSQAELLANRNAFAKQLERDVSDRTEKLASALVQLKALDRAKSEFFANISHDLRNPLAVIAGPLSALETDSRSTEQRSQLVSLAQRGVQRLDSMIGDLLELARIDAGVSTLQTAVVEMRSFIYDVARQFQPHAQSLEIELFVVTADRPIFAEVDVEKMERVLMNLLTNALKHARSHGRVGLTVSEETDNRIRIEVEDNGTGIPSSDLPLLFTRFGRGKSHQPKAIPGVGLGLAVAKDLVELHRGTICVDSQEGCGAKFSIVLPIRMGNRSGDSLEVR